MSSDIECSGSSGESHMSSDTESEISSEQNMDRVEKVYTNTRWSRTKARVDTIIQELGLSRSCLVQNLGRNNQVKYTYCLGRSQDRQTLTRLEFHWGLDKGALNLDTRYNILFLTVEFRNYFNEDPAFILLPERRFLEGYFRKSREEIVITDDKLYDYKLIAFETMNGVPLLRQKNSECNLSVFSSTPDLEGYLPPISREAENYIDDFILSPYPYEDLPLLRSHIYPRYAIVKGGESLLGIKQPELIERQVNAILVSVERPQLSTLNWVLSSLLEQIPLLLAHPSQMAEFIQTQVAMLAEHRSNLTENQLTELIRGQAASLFTKSVTVGTVNALRLQLIKLQKRLRILEYAYPANVDDLVLLVAVYFQWCALPPLNHPFFDEESLPARADSSDVTGTRPYTYRAAEKRRINTSTPTPGGANKRNRLNA